MDGIVELQEKLTQTTKERDKARAEATRSAVKTWLDEALGPAVDKGARKAARAEIVAQFSDEDVQSVLRHLSHVWPNPHAGQLSLGDRLLKVIRPEVK